MKKQWIVGTALLMLMTGNAWADGEPPTENILKINSKSSITAFSSLMLSP
ncbi:hypothetical protein ACLK17_17830 [Escherichia coli]